MTDIMALYLSQQVFYYYLQEYFVKIGIKVNMTVNGVAFVLQHVCKW